jgi:LysM repeat protein
MRPRWLSFPAALLSVALTACVNNGGLLSSNNPTGTGPFDSRGNYVEAWADNPSQWRKGSNQVVEAAPDKPAATVPVAPPVLVSNTAPKPASSSTPVIHKKPVTTKPTAVASNTVKPKPVVKKPVVKAKPKTTRHTVRSGENLYNIAKRYGTSVGAVQKANGIKGAMIRPGQSLVIPR